MISKHRICALLMLTMCTITAFAAEPGSDSLVVALTDTLVEPTGNLSLAQVQALAILHSPQLQSYAWERRVAEARRVQAGVYPNPELGLDIENGPGTGELRGFDNAEQTLQVSQLLELGGKRQKRLSVSGLERDLAKWDYEAVRLDVLAEVTQRFYEVLAAQERSALAEENTRLAEDVLTTATKRVQTGIASADEEMKARLAVALARIEKDRAERLLITAKLQLAATWGSGRQPSFDRVNDGFDSLVAVPSYDVLAEHLAKNPDMERWNSELARRESIVSLERASRTPDVTIAAGVRRFSAGGDLAMVMGASIPIPLFDTNQGNIQAAHLGVIKGQTERRTAAIRINSMLSDAYRNLSSAYNEATKLKSEVLPEAQRVFEAAGEKYRQGKSSYLEVLDAERTVVEVRGRYVDALESYHTARAQVERLIGQSLNAVNTAEDKK